MRGGCGALVSGWYQQPPTTMTTKANRAVVRLGEPIRSGYATNLSSLTSLEHGPVGAAGSSRVAKQLPPRLGVAGSTMKTLMIGLGRLVRLLRGNVHPPRMGVRSMPPRRPTLPPPPEIKQFAPDEIEQGIRKLGRRIEEVQALDPGQVRRDDQRVRNVEQNIDTTILEVFGPNSPEYRRHHHHQIWHGPHVLFEMPPAEVQACFARGIPQTVTMLEGLIHVLEEKRVDFAGDTTTRVRAAFRGLDLHPRIAAVCADPYRDDH